MIRRPLVRRLVIGYMAAVGVAVHLALLSGAVVMWRRYGFAVAARKVVSVTESAVPHRAPMVRQLFGMIGIEVPGRSAEDGIRFPEMSSWTGWGASLDPAASVEPASIHRNVEVTDEEHLRHAIATASAGDVITLLPGTYRVAAKYLPLYARGDPQNPIVLRARRLGDAVIEFDALEGFLVLGPHWRFENLDIRGVCAAHSDCEHAFHIVGEARGIVVRNSVLRDFNAAIKGNGLVVAGAQVFPDDVVVESNTIYNTTTRSTDNPVTPIDVVGANGWVVRGNLIADFAKSGGDRVSYAAFFKGNSARGVFERNLVICAMNVLDPGTTRVGLSLGGGGSSSGVCRDGTCIPEHTEGVIRNNIILHCNDVGIHLNRSASTQVLHNTLHDTAGIEIRFPESQALVANNLLSGSIRDRSGGQSVRSHNLAGIRAATLRKWFVDPDRADFRAKDASRLTDRGEDDVRLEQDFCGERRRDSSPDIGAIEYSNDGEACDPSRDTGIRASHEQ